MLTTDNLISALVELSYPDVADNAERARLRAEFVAARTALEAQWKEWLAVSYLTGFPQVVTDAVYAAAEEAGHADGYFTIEQEYDDRAMLAVLVKENL